MHRWLLLLLLLFVVSGSEAQPPESDVFVVWTAAGDIYLWSGGDAPSVIPTGDATRAFLAPDGERIAYVTTQDTLHIINTDGETILQTEPYPVIQQVGWSVESVYFNTAELTELGLSPRHDLHRVHFDSGAVSAIEPGGWFSISPDYSQIVVIDPGRYGDAEATIYRLDPLQELLRFPAVASGTHTPFYPLIQWQVDGRFVVAIPDADALYSVNPAETPPVVLWEIMLNGEAQQIGRVPADFYGLPRQSADAVVYLRRSGNNYDLYIANADGSEATLYDDSITAVPPQWIGEQFTYVKDGSYWLGQTGEVPQRWLDSGSTLIRQPTVVGDVMIYGALNGEALELRYATPDSQESSLIATLAEPTRFHALEVEG